MAPILRLAILAAFSFRLATAATQPAGACINVSAECAGPLANIGGAVGFAPAPVTLGDIPALLGSTVTSFDAPAAQGEATKHLTLVHTFVSTDPARPGTLTTLDRAVCAPTGTEPSVCRVDGVLTIASGTGIFAHAAGSLRNQGELNFNTFSLAFSIRGRICGDGL